MNKNNTMSLCVVCHDVADRWNIEIIPKIKKRKDMKAIRSGGPHHVAAVMLLQYTLYLLGIPDNFDVMAMIAIGKRGPEENLPISRKETIQTPLSEIEMEGRFKQHYLIK